MTDDRERPGLGKVIYSVDDEDHKPPANDTKAKRKEVEEADVESFPASDPPSFTGSASTEGEKSDPS